MELVYAYIDKYRTFSKQEILFSKKFEIKYNKEKTSLRIKENPNYFNIYPQNIVNINGILGKNATGKTSLLHLIADSTYAYQRNKIRINPHKPIHFLTVEEYENNSDEEVKYWDSYFLLYFVGKDKYGKNKFVFESNYPEQYQNIFTFENEIDFEHNKRRWSFITFSVTDSDNENQIKARIDNNSDLIRKNKILLFEKMSYISAFRYAITSQEHPDRGFKRNVVPMDTAFLQDKTKYLIKMMRTEKRELYKNSEYVLRLTFNDYYKMLEYYGDEHYEDDIGELISDYRYFEKTNLKEWEKITLAFLQAYAGAKYVEVSRKQRDKNAKLELNNISKFEETLNINNFNSGRELYLYIIKIFLTEEEYGEFEISELTLEEFLKKAKNFDFKYEYHQENGRSNLDIKITAESRIGEVIKTFYDKFLDLEANVSLSKEKDSILSGMIAADFIKMSEGEKENLGLFAAINNQINVANDGYILAFDEIERSLHPEVSRKLIYDLIMLLKEYKDKEFQIILSSHSPFIVSDLLSTNIVSLDNNAGDSHVTKLVEETFGQNIHVLLKSQFFLNSFIGEYSKEVINRIVVWLDAGKLEEARRLINEFMGNKVAVCSDDDVKNFLKYTISLIGEPIIRNELMLRLDNKNWYSKDEMIRRYEEKIQDYKEKIEKLKE